MKRPWRTFVISVVLPCVAALASCDKQKEPDAHNEVGEVRVFQSGKPEDKATTERQAEKQTQPPKSADSKPASPLSK